MCKKNWLRQVSTLCQIQIGDGVSIFKIFEWLTFATHSFTNSKNRMFTFPNCGAYDHKSSWNKFEQGFKICSILVYDVNCLANILFAEVVFGQCSETLAPIQITQFQFKYSIFNRCLSWCHIGLDKSQVREFLIFQPLVALCKL